MVFIGNPRSETNREGGDRIVLRSKHSNLKLRHTCSILSIKINQKRGRRDGRSTRRHPEVRPTLVCVRRLGRLRLLGISLVALLRLGIGLLALLLLGISLVALQLLGISLLGT